MIYEVRGFGAGSTYFVANEVIKAEVLAANPSLVCVVGAELDAQQKLATKQQEVLVSESTRFSICATFSLGNDSVWRELQSTDPENIVCQVFNTFTGQYTEYQNKTDAVAANTALQNQFLASVGLDKVITHAGIESLPRYINTQQPRTTGLQSL